jgi:hypothetical protein
MSLEIWPPLPPDQLEVAIAETKVDKSPRSLHSYPAGFQHARKPFSLQKMVLIDPRTGRKARELAWLLRELHEDLLLLKAGLEECYALLAPIDPGSTLVLSTSRNELVKGHITRVGTRIVKGTIQLKLKTLPPQTLTIDPNHPIHLAPLTGLHALLTHSIDLLGLTLQYAYDPDPSGGTKRDDVKGATGGGGGAIPPSSSPMFMATQLRLLAQSLAEASALLKGPAVGEADPSWTYRSAAPSHFIPPLAPLNAHGHHLGHASSSSALSTLSHLAGVGGNHQNGHHLSHVKSAESQASITSTHDHGHFDPPALSFHLTIQDGSLVLWLRSLEPADAPMHFGTKLALAIGTARRLEHDEADHVFGFCCGAVESRPQTPNARRPSPDLPSRRDSAASKLAAVAAKSEVTSRTSSPFGGWGKARHDAEKRERPSSAAGGEKGHEVSVYVREKVRVESADPSLLALSAKLTALGHTLGLARRNLAAVMGEELEE